MAKNEPEGAQPFATDLQPSSDLVALLKKLSPAQAAAVIRIAEAEIKGVSIERLLTGPDPICSRSTYYHKARGGWKHKPAFKNALDLARREVRGHRLFGAVTEAIEELKLATPLAAADLRRQITGDMAAIDALTALIADPKRKAEERALAVKALGQIGSTAAVVALTDVFEQCSKEMRQEIIGALGEAGAATDTRRRMAAIAILDRADRMTADKGGGGSRTSEMSDEELEKIAASERED